MDSPTTSPRAAAGLLNALAGSRDSHFVLQDFWPLAQSLEWELGQMYWDRRGIRAFISDGVPFTTTSDGNLSMRAAELLFCNLEEARQQGTLEPEIWLLELGIGTGLFARFLLDCLRDLCAANGRDYYQRCRFLAADGSARMIADVEELGVLAGHPGRYVLCRVDAARPEEDLARLTANRSAAKPRFRAVFLNYLLDSLPAAVLRIEPGGVSQLCVRTCVGRGVELEDYTRLSREELARRAASSDPAEKAALLDLCKVLYLDCEFRPVDVESLPYSRFIPTEAGPQCRYWPHSYGAIRSLHGLLPWLCDDGFILINDYGFSQPEQVASFHGHQRFAGSTAIGLNFPLLQAACEGVQGCRWFEPAADHARIHARMLARNPGPATEKNFRERFDRRALAWFRQPVELARSCAKEGRTDAAISAYVEALRRQPHNCYLLEEAAWFLSQTNIDCRTGCQLAEAALAQNPISSTLYNVYGDCLFYSKRMEEAHAAYQRALELDPDNVVACCNLIQTHTHYRDYPAALQMVARGLACDRSGKYQDRLLKAQAEVVQCLSRRRQVEAACHAGQLNRTTYQDVLEEAAERQSASGDRGAEG